jgi:hypothetical protein
MCNVSILLIFGLEVFKFAFEIMNFEDFVHKSYSLLCGEKHAWRHNIHDIGSKCSKNIFIFSTQSTFFCRNFFCIMATKCCGIFLNVLVKKNWKILWNFQNQKIERENMHVIENWVQKMKHKWQYKPIKKNNVSNIVLGKNLTFDTPSFYYCDCTFTIHF